MNSKDRELLVNVFNSLELLRTNGIALNAGDVEIGAVEIKNATTDDRAEVQAGNTAAAADVALTVADPNVKSDTAAMKTALEIIDDWDNNDAAKTVGVTVTVETTITRPSDTNTYAANDVICNSTSAPTIQTITGCARYNLGSGTIIDAVLIDGGNETLKLDADFFLFDTTVTMDNDNAAFTPTDTEMGTYVGVIQFVGGTARSGTAGTGGNCVYPNALASQPIAFTCVTTTTLYGILVARNAYVPISGETFKIRMKIYQE